jgi:hypothetical protein
MTGGDAVSMVALLEGLGADMIGANCGVGPDLILPTAKTLVKYASVPVLIKANAGLPTIVDGKTVFTVTPEEFAKDAKARGHSTAADAAGIAVAAEAQRLIIGHFSSRYKSPEVLLNEAKEIFENTLLAEEGTTYTV